MTIPARHTDRGSGSGRSDGHTLAQLLQEIAVASNEARTVEEALGLALQHVCHHTHWPVGHAWWRPPGSGELLVSSGAWYAEPSARFEPLRQAVLNQALPLTTGLPGRVWSAKEPVWIRDIALDDDLPRAAVASGIGIHAALAFPVTVAGDVAAVLEFFSDRAQDPDPDLLKTMASIGTQLGRVVERQHAEEALRASEERYRTLVESAVDAIITSGYDGIIREWNRGAEAMFGYAREEAVGRPLTMMMPLRYRQLHESGMQRYRETATPHVIGRTVELHGLRSDGQEFPVELSLSRWQASGEDFFTGIIRDVTERHAASAALRRSKHSLERSNARLRERNQQLQEFAYAASHDLQEPLRKIAIFSELVRADYGSRLGRAGRAHLERIADAAGRMSALVRDLLAYSHVSTRGRAFSAVDLRNVVRDVQHDLEVLLSESGGTVAMEGLATVEADPVQMRQLFQNLISNGLKFRRPGVPPVVRISTSIIQRNQDDGPPQEVCAVRVEDNGIGFEEKYAERIFSPFQRLHTREEYSGTGIGLALCLRIVERHRGRIRARGTPGEGTTIEIVLPVSRHRRGAARGGTSSGT